MESALNLWSNFDLLRGCMPKFGTARERLQNAAVGDVVEVRATLGDGRVDVVFVRRASRWQMLKLFNSVFDGSHMSLPCVEYRQVSSFSIEPEDVDSLNLDGEIKGRSPVSAEIMPAALEISARGSLGEVVRQKHWVTRRWEDLRFTGWYFDASHHDIAAE